MVRRTPRDLPRSPPRTVALAFVLVAVLLLGSCQRTESPPSPPAPTVPVPESLTTIVRPGPTSWYVGPSGDNAGLDHDLLVQFARSAGLPLHPVLAGSAVDVIDKVASGEARIGGGGVYRPPGRPADDPAPAVLYSRGYHTVEPVLIYTADAYKPKGFADLKGAAVGYVQGSGMEQALAGIRARHPGIAWKATPVPTAEALIAKVDEGELKYAVVASHQAAVARNIYLNFDVAFPAGASLELAFVLSPGQERLRAQLDAFIAEAKKTGLIERYVERYFGHTQEVQRIDAGVFRERIGSLLPEYRKLFHEAQEASGVEWRLLAAVSYQESQWDPLATSETGPRGLMQMTEDTAKHLGVSDRLDPRQSIAGAARYIQDLRARLPARIAEPDRTWLALAAFNIGLGHLEDARILAQRQKLNPDLWKDVKKTLPLLALPEYYENAKLGYARGGMPVAFVDRVRAYYDILLRYEKAHQPRLRVQTAQAGP